jgi:hypothetical protein
VGGGEEGFDGEGLCGGVGLGDRIAFGLGVLDGLQCVGWLCGDYRNGDVPGL